MSIKLNMPRMIRAENEPISIERALQVAPAIATKRAGPTTLSGYQYLDTEAVVRQFMEQGFVITEVAQERSPNVSWMDEFGKHLVRMRHHKDFRPKADRTLDDVVPETIIVNAHNASSKLHLLAGVWRFLCLNGLMAGHMIGGFHQRHNAGSAKDFVAAAVEQMAKEIMPKILHQIERMLETRLTDEQQRQFASAARAMRWGPGKETVTLDALLAHHRPQDKGDTVWQTFNRVQENLLQGGFSEARRNASVRRVENVTRVIQLNQGLWDKAVGLTA